jgi:putative transposase
MPRRKTPLVNGEIYHIYNRGIDGRKTFTSPKEYCHALVSILLYQIGAQTHRLSDFIELQDSKQKQIISNNVNNLKTSILTYCLMPNHFHLLLRQEIENGITSHLKEFQNSYTRYFNIRHSRSGPLFSTQFKAVRIETENQFLHVSRYIHLNPYSSKLIKNKNGIFTYPWSSAHLYADQKPTTPANHYPILDKTPLDSHFQTNQRHRQFILDNADHQRHLKQIQHLTLE